jgi:N-acetylneuraminic acid mutarotase
MQGQFSKTETIAFPAEARSDALAFGLGDYLYAGTGFTNFFYQVNDWWRFHYPTQAWERLPDLPFEARQYAMGFTHEKYIYVFGGWAGNDNYFNDFWRFDTERLLWKQLDSLPGRPRWAGIAFSIGGYGYIGGGDDTATTLKDFYRFSFAEERWEKLPDLPFGGRMHACAASNGLQAIIGLGTSDAQEVYNDLYLFDGVDLRFKQLINFPKYLQRAKAIWHSKGEREEVWFLGGQQRGGAYNPYLYKLDVNSHTVDSMLIDDIPTRRSMGFTNYRDGMAIAFGLTDSNRFIQSVTFVDQDLNTTTEAAFSFYPNPVTNNFLVLRSTNAIRQCKLYSLEGKTVYSKLFDQGSLNRLLQLPTLKKGLYTLAIKDETGKWYYRKLIIQKA